MAEVIRLTDEYYIAAPSSTTQDSRVLKDGETFGVFDLYGDIRQTGLGEQGIYHEGTRYLSHLLFRLGNNQPFLLSSTVKQDNQLFTVDLTNPDIYSQGQIVLRRGDLHLFRSKFIWQASCYESLRIVNYGLAPVAFTFSLQFDADYADIFEVRGVKRAKRGTRLPDQLDTDHLTFSYRGLDQAIRRTDLHFSPAPKILSASEALFDTTLQSKEEQTYTLTYSFQSHTAHRPLRTPELARRDAKQALDALHTEECTIRTSNDEFNSWLNRSLSDLRMMYSETAYGIYPYAGVPWFSTPFGRDGIITALEVLWLNPQVARGVLKYLAAYQATQLIAEKDAEPGKILHEVRLGEMAALQEIPFDRYYGSTDATPLFVMLAGAYYERTGDMATIRDIWPNILLALSWIDTYGDGDGDGFVETMRHSSHGLVQQGWKDSWDSVSHSDGSLPQFPLALCEVQGYVYDAKLAAASLATVMGENQRAHELTAQAETLKDLFNRKFWCDAKSTYAIALDRDKQPCAIKASNAGHCLFTGIATVEYARRVADTLLGDGSFSGWGVRTLDMEEVRYNPMAYHNGSVWPHDNAIIAAGLARYGCNEGIHKIMSGLFDASLFFDLQRLPELFCGFGRRAGEAPTLYPVACSPQAWAAGAVFLLLQTCLGLSIQANQSTVCLTSPSLPEFVSEVHIDNLRVGSGTVGLVMDRAFRGIGVERRVGEATIVLR
jgi:glycogen debranching enzyme